MRKRKTVARSKVSPKLKIISAVDCCCFWASSLFWINCLGGESRRFQSKWDTQLKGWRTYQSNNFVLCARPNLDRVNICKAVRCYRTESHMLCSLEWLMASQIQFICLREVDNSVVTLVVLDCFGFLAKTVQSLSGWILYGVSRCDMSNWCFMNQLFKKNEFFFEYFKKVFFLLYITTIHEISRSIHFQCLLKFIRIFS